MTDQDLWDDLTLDTTPAATDRIVKVASTSADFDSVELDAVQRVHVGSAFPTENLYDGYPFHRTDINSGLDCFYDATNTRWVTAELHGCKFAYELLTGDATMAEVFWVGNDYAIATERIAIRTYVATTNDGSKYWTVTCSSTALDGTATSILAFTTASDTASTYTKHDAAASTVAPANYGGFKIAAAKTSTPGNMYVYATIYYRLIIT